ncbi:hypothetical protein [Haloplanus salilacus]|uniref:hypothetical protein n=1 Tax=Haloplanus salilacus TaxID=2949994 RepID=UPI0030CF01C7
MPISDVEWDDGAQSAGSPATRTASVGRYGDEGELTVAFLPDSVDNVDAKMERVRGNDAHPESLRQVLTERRDGLVAEGVVAVTSDGTTNYRLDTDEARE